MSGDEQELPLPAVVTTCVAQAYRHLEHELSPATLQEWMHGFTVGLVLSRRAPEYAMALLKGFEAAGVRTPWYDSIADLMYHAMPAPFTDTGGLRPESL